METTLQLFAYEEILMNIVRSLPAERVIQILDYARYIQSQTDKLITKDETEEEIIADEEHWNSQFAATLNGLKKMADKVRSDIRAGRSMPMVFTKEEKILIGY
jgi:hypothetical protein